MVKYVNVRSKSRTELIDVTEMVQEVVKETGVTTLDYTKGQ